MRRILLCVVVTACTNDPPSDPPVNCAMVEANGGADVYTVGLEKLGQSASLDFKLMSVSPAPPQRGDNSWVVQINAMSGGSVGSPINGASITATPFMPAHQHGTPVEVQITAMPTPGQYTLAPVNLWMPGVWQTTIAASQGSTFDQTVYSFCIPN